MNDDDNTYCDTSLSMYFRINKVNGPDLEMVCNYGKTEKNLN